MHSPAAFTPQATFPVLTDITLSYEGETYPVKIPDLYMGSSVVVAGKFSGPFPQPGNSQSKHFIYPPLAQTVASAIGPLLHEVLTR